MKSLRAIFALYTLLWFNVFVPGHVRGIVTLPPTDGKADASLTDAGGCCHADAPAKSGKPTDEQKRRCAVCFVAAISSAAEHLSVDLRPAGEVCLGSIDLPAQVRSSDYPLAFYPTGPPARCF